MNKTVWIPSWTRDLLGDDGKVLNDADCVMGGGKKECKVAPYPHSRTCFDVFATALVECVKTINDGLDDMTNNVPNNKGELKYDAAREQLARILMVPTADMGFALTEFTPILTDDDKRVRSLFIKAEVAGSAPLNTTYSSSPPTYAK